MAKSSDVISLFHGDCVSVCRDKIPSDTIDCIVTSPPYDGIRDYRNGASFDANALGHELLRVLKDGCFAVVLIADQKKKKQLSLTTARIMLDWVDNVGFRLCDWLIYKRQGRIGRYHSFRRDHESILVFFKGDVPRDIDTEALKKPVLVPSIGRSTNISMRNKGDVIGKRKFVAKSDLMCRGSVWEYKGWGGAMPVSKGWHLRHPAMMRDSLARDLVLAFSDKGDKVLDPFCGSGTTGAMCVPLGRSFVGIDISKEYCDLAAERIEIETSQSSIFPV
ncbi:MAG: site-specific DNA-methyltransferase [Gammaproteobacteria bacterium AqS3]|nr:site-specific DNA-methyltransferase [Gammaproteobacteria bacterium AqS3]